MVVIFVRMWSYVILLALGGGGFFQFRASSRVHEDEQVCGVFFGGRWFSVGMVVRSERHGRKTLYGDKHELLYYT